MHIVDEQVLASPSQPETAQSQVVLGDLSAATTRTVAAEDLSATLRLRQTPVPQQDQPQPVQQEARRVNVNYGIQPHLRPHAALGLQPHLQPQVNLQRIDPVAVYF